VLDALASSAPLTGTIRLFRIRSGLLTVPAGFPNASSLTAGVTSTADGVPTPSDREANGLIAALGEDSPIGPPPVKV
jgi:hypothetical protein